MNVHGTERQRDGAIIIVIIASVFLAISSSFSLIQPKTGDLPFGNNTFGPVIVGIVGYTGLNGIFYLPDKARVCDLLRAAGVRNSNLFDQKTLDEPLATGKSVIIESNYRLKIGEMNNANKFALGIPIDINKATLEDLLLINGIGEKTARQIVEFREKSGKFHKVEDLMRIHGIKERKFERLRRYFCTDSMP